MRIKTEWNLGLLYKSPKDPKIEKDIRSIEQAHIQFEKKYRDKTDYLKNEKKLLTALQDYEKMAEALAKLEPLRYFHLLQDLNASDKKVEAMLNKMTERLTKSGNKLLFFRLNLSKIDKKLQEKFLKNLALKKYHYLLKVQFDQGKYRLSEPEEKILSLKRMPSSGLWVQMGEKFTTKQTVPWKGKHMPISEASNLLPALPVQERRKLQVLVSDSLHAIADVAENEINAIVLNKKINDELRGYEKPYSATVLNYENSVKSIENLVESVTKHFPISHRFYKVKKKMLKLSHLEYEDRAARAGSIGGKLPFDKAYELVRTAFAALDNKYPKILDRFLRDGQIDVFPKKGKRGGAFCMGAEATPTFVLLNHTPDLNSTMTLAHEMGHAFHAELARAQPTLYWNHTISVAEVASTFFEAVVFDHVLNHLTEKEKIIALHDKIQDDIQTIFRQIALFNFEKELHTQIREKGSLSKEELAALLNKHMKTYLGPEFKMKEKDGYQFVTWMHIRRFFYVYAYAYGQIISRALYKNYKKDKNYLKKIEQFLSAGGSKSPEDIFKDIGIDTSKPQFFVDGLKSIEEDIKKLEKLTK